MSRPVREVVLLQTVVVATLVAVAMLHARIQRV